MTNKLLEIIFRGKNELGAAVSSVKNDLDGVAESAKKTSSAMDVAFGVLASTSLQRFADISGQLLSGMIENANEAQLAMAQLETVLKSTGGVAGVSAEEVLAFSDAMQSVTMFSDEAITNAQSLLLTFTKIGKEVFPDATKAALNMSTALGQDLQSSITMIGKALNDPVAGITAMTRAGIQFTEAQKDMIAALVESGDLLGAQKVILAELETQFGGSAEAAGSTFAGSMERLKNSVGNFGEAVGNALIENESFQKGIDLLVDVIDKLSETFEKLPEGVQTFIVSIFLIGSALGQVAPTLIGAKLLLGDKGGLLSIFKGLGPKIAGAAASLGGLKGALVGIGAALASPIAGVALLAAAIGTLIYTIITLGPAAWDTFMMIADIIAASLKRAGYEIQRFWYGLVNWAKAMAANMKAWFATVGRGIVEGIWLGIKEKWDWLVAEVKALAEKLLQAAKDKIKSGSPSEVWAQEVGVPMAQGVGVGFKRGMGIAAPSIAASLMPSPAFATAGGGAMSVGHIEYHGSLSRDERQLLRRDSERMAQNTILRTTRPRRR